MRYRTKKKGVSGAELSRVSGMKHGGKRLLARAIVCTLALGLMLAGFQVPAQAVHDPCEDGTRIRLLNTPTVRSDIYVLSSTGQVCVAYGLQLWDATTGERIAWITIRVINARISDPDSQSPGYRVRGDFCIAAQDERFTGAGDTVCQAFGWTGAEAGRVTPTTGATSGAALGNTCLWVNGTQHLPTCTLTAASAEVAQGDLIPNPVVDPTPSQCLITFGGVCAGPPRHGKAQFGRDPNKTIRVEVAGIPFEYDLPPNTCVGIGCP